MSLNLGHGEGRIAELRERLRATFGRQTSGPDRLDPVSQLVRSILGSRTKDAVSWAAFMRLASGYPEWTMLAGAGAGVVAPLIEEVSYVEKKAREIPLALWQIQRDRGALSLDFLAEHGVEAATAWLCGLTGVRPKVAASVLNFSRLNMRAFVVDPHVHRVARRLGLIGWGCDSSKAHELLLDAMPDAWAPDDLLEMHWLMKILGQQACSHAEPRCHICPLAQDCPKRGVEGAAVLAFRPKA
ncbi:MAG: hypothetical protein BGN86_01525 [Caulobacterales bacterium 68-7]|nr:MAG: hypothetical protein BGN86_01525 [Caulobacterales bacterium 68-7]